MSLLVKKASIALRIIMNYKVNKLKYQKQDGHIAGEHYPVGYCRNCNKKRISLQISEQFQILIPSQP
jgi:hypothetical protein